MLLIGTNHLLVVLTPNVNIPALPPHEWHRHCRGSHTRNLCVIFSSNFSLSHLTMSPQSSLSPVSWTWSFSPSQATLLATELGQQPPNGPHGNISYAFGSLSSLPWALYSAGEKPMSRICSFINSNLYHCSTMSQTQVFLCYIPSCLILFSPIFVGGSPDL